MRYIYKVYWTDMDRGFHYEEGYIQAKTREELAERVSELFGSCSQVTILTMNHEEVTIDR